MTYNDYMNLYQQLLKIGDSLYTTRDDPIRSSSPYSVEETFVIGFMTGIFSKLEEQYNGSDGDVTFFILREMRKCLANQDIMNNVREALTQPLKNLPLMIGSCDRVTTIFIEYRLRVGR